MIEIFKTDVNNEMAAQKIIAQLQIIFAGCKVNFDLDDCDCILRVCSETYLPDLSNQVIAIVNTKGYLAVPLIDDLAQSHFPLSTIDGDRLGINAVLSIF